MNFYPFHIGDYISHTHHLTDAEDLAYRRMIDLYYLTEKPLPDDYEWIAKRVGSTPDIVITILNEFFGCHNNDDGLWHNKRADVEIAKYQFIKESGKKGAEKRWANRDAISTQCQPNSHPNATPLATKTNNQEPLPIPNIKADVAKAPKAQRLKLEELPNDWQVFCKTERPDLNPQAIWNQFKDYWIAQGGQKGAKLDWFATWRNWVRNQKSVVNYTSDKPAQKWDTTLAGIMSKGKELGIEPKPGETEGQYRERVRMGRA